MLAVSFFVGMMIVSARSRKAGIPSEFAVNLALLVIISGVAGARVTYALYHWSEFAGSPFDIFNPFGSSEGFGIAGLNLQGGLVLSFASAIAYCRKKHQPILAVFDLFSPVVALGIFLTRIGCFLNGCCFGTECHLPWAVHFPQGSIPHSYLGDVPLHPTQLYSSLYGLMLFFLLTYLDNRKRFTGLTFSLFLIVEAFFRFLIEYVRFYEPEMWTELFGISFTWNHIVAIIMFLAGISMLLVFRRKAIKPVRL
jgi:phosphatidylglycerol:prolipoprotein diacylglycerol transferase